MKKQGQRRCLAALIFTLGIGLPAALVAQSFSVLHHFDFAEGSQPLAGVSINGSYFYGSTLRGGEGRGGTLFKVHIAGTNYLTLKHFGTSIDDGGFVYGGILVDGETLYGTTQYGGSNSDSGLVFRICTNGSNYQILHQFDRVDVATGTNQGGAYPCALLCLVDGFLYGSTTSAGPNGCGTLFKVGTTGSNFSVLHSFSRAGIAPDMTNADGWDVQSKLVLDDGALLGAARNGGTNVVGTMFRRDLDGNDFTLLWTAPYDFPSWSGTNSIGFAPCGDLLLVGDTVYGTMSGGGEHRTGTIFRMKKDGTAYCVLKTFSYADPSLNNYSNLDGAVSSGGLVMVGGVLYGTTAYGGTNGNGTVFMIGTNGENFAVLKQFSAIEWNGADDANDDGAHPYGTLVATNNTLYGTASEGGHFGGGVIFSLPIPLPLEIGGESVHLGSQSSTFGFRVTGTENQNVVIESCTNLISPVWIPKETNTILSGGFNFCDPSWTNNAIQYYRVRKL